MLAGYEAQALEGDRSRALAFCEQALAAEQRLGATPSWPLSMLASELRGVIALSAGATSDAVDHYLDASRQARAEHAFALAAIYLGHAAANLSYLDPAAARQHAAEGLALARQSGMPTAISISLLALAQALAEDDPDQARTLLDEALQRADTLDYENSNETATAVFVAARLEAWPLALRAAGRALHRQNRRFGSFYLAGILNLVARGLAEHRPESAAVLQGAVSALMQPITTGTGTPSAAVAPQPNPYAAVATRARHDTTQLLTAALGEARLRGLRAQGGAMDEDQACTYARTHIDDYLAAIDEVLGG
jgi:hypothetical protein